jgi:Interferon-induced 6-16 family
MPWVLCLHCGRPLNNEENVSTLRRVIFVTGAGGLVLGGALLPAFGFGLGGITAGSFAAGMQGPAVAAGSMFAILQSLGATGMGILLFGSLGAAVGVLAPLAAQLGWCNGNCNHHQQ